MIRLPSDIRAIVSGQSNSGKTIYLRKLLENQESIFDKPFDNILYCYRIYQPLFDEMKSSIKNFSINEGMPDLEIVQNNDAALFIFDDFLNTLTKQDIDLWTSLFTKMRHRNKAVIVITQNLFSKENVVLRRNANFLFLFPNIGGRSMIKVLSQQIFPNHKGFLYDAYMQSIETNYNPLIVDLRVTTNEQLRVLEGILPNEDMYFYVPTKTLGHKSDIGVYI